MTQKSRFWRNKVLSRSRRFIRYLKSCYKVNSYTNKYILFLKIRTFRSPPMVIYGIIKTIILTKGEFDETI